MHSDQRILHGMAGDLAPGDTRAPGPIQARRLRSTRGIFVVFGPCSGRGGVSAGAVGSHLGLSRGQMGEIFGERPRAITDRLGG